MEVMFTQTHSERGMLQDVWDDDRVMFQDEGDHI